MAQMMQISTPGALRARTLQTAASLAYRQGDWLVAKEWLVESLALYQAAADRTGVARVLFDLGWIAVDRADWAEAARLNQESLCLARENGDPHATFSALTIAVQPLAGHDFEAALRQDRSMSLDAVVAFALDCGGEPISRQA